MSEESPKKPQRLSRKERERREFLRTSALVAGVGGFSLLQLIPTLTDAAPRLRPPGALDEKEYLSSCIKCGQCVQVCPVEAIFLADMLDGQGQGAAYIDARNQACDFSCDGLQCVLACPTGALTHEINYSHETRMGIARLDKPAQCLAVKGEGFFGITRGAEYNGKLRFDEIDRWNPIALNQHPFDLEVCDLCVRLCPIEIRRTQCEVGKPPSGDINQCPPKPAIELQKIENGRDTVSYVPAVLEGCVGCGVCEMVCPTDEPAIVIDIRKQWSEVNA
ncbi:MAG: 4Fe-4S binding protein [Gammaproteobacteria bacterium]|jgi:ferredoxin-type protein NapG|nr:4Fe-4S binding protein [Gammaproteobacteria bacterium]MBT4605736.1 4Fe-4S binding protein [Thiotrichales bacterium]MBT3472817.1 4Fe-4S binding protein [Gammaproteobacteria bacterium]MBT4079601.1 4Fe-4S binding protein [Gammaproteobacteria bacterium]MBT4331098.1 4Fe-4S binding protein [Gammaproteobacteria bacterium]